MSTSKSVEPAPPPDASAEDAAKKGAEPPKRGSIPPTRLQRTLSDAPTPSRSRLPTLPRATDRASRTMQAVRPGSFGGSSSAPPLPLGSTPTPVPVAPRKSAGPSPSVSVPSEPSRENVTKTFVGVEPPITKTFVGLEPSSSAANRQATRSGVGAPHVDKPSPRIAPKPPKAPSERSTLPHIDLSPAPAPAPAAAPAHVEAKPARALVHPPLPRKRLDSIDEGWGFESGGPPAPAPPTAPSAAKPAEPAPEPERAIDSIPIDSAPIDSAPIDSVPIEVAPPIEEAPPIEGRGAEAKASETKHEEERVEIPIAVEPPPLPVEPAHPHREAPHPPLKPHPAPSGGPAVQAIPSWTPPVEAPSAASQAPSLSDIARTAAARTSRPDGPPLSTPPPWTNQGSKARVPLAIAGGVALLAIGFFAGRASVDVPAPQSSEVATTTQPAPTVTAGAVPDPAPTAAPSPSGQDTAEPSASTSGSSKKKKKKKGSSGASAEGADGESAVAEVAPEHTEKEKPARSEKAESPEPKPEKQAKGTAPFDKSAANAALASAVASAASGCKQPGDPSGQAVVSVTFLPSGKATTSKLSGPPFQGTPTGSCIARTLRSAKIPPFVGDPVTVTKTVSIR